MKHDRGLEFSIPICYFFRVNRNCTAQGLLLGSYASSVILTGPGMPITVLYFYRNAF